MELKSENVYSPLVKTCFVSFADSRMREATTRIAKQAKEMDFFDEIHVYNEDGLDESFCQRWGHVLRVNVRGYGYWCWKSHVILRAMESLPDGAVLLYCDAGCHLNPKGRQRLLDYVDELMQDPLGVKAFYTYYPYCDVSEKRWTKGDLFDYFHCRERTDITDSPQLAATQVLCRKCDSSMQLLREWQNTWMKNFSLIDDTKSKSPNFSCFLEHRHDQSIFSLLFKLKGGVPLPSGETDVADWKSAENFPVLDKRDRGTIYDGFICRLKRAYKTRVFRAKILIERIISRVRRNNMC